MYGRQLSRYIGKDRTRALREKLPQCSLLLSQAHSVSFYKKFPWRELEVGFGAGEHFNHRLNHNRKGLYIGCELFRAGIGSFLVNTPSIEGVYIAAFDARVLLEIMPSNVLDRFTLFFPDPWPKKRHYKRRLLTRECVWHVHRILRKGGEAHIATDHDDLWQWMFSNIKQEGCFSSIHMMDDTQVFMTRFYTKAVISGRGVSYVKLVK